MPIAAGTRFGVYEIVEPIGAGGMGEVYRAMDVGLKRDVAIKVLPEAFANDADRLARFRREAETLAALNHPNIAQIYGLEKSDAGTLIVMELVAGPTLADRIADGPLPPDEALGIARQIASALEAAHGRQIVHRDLKPANVKLRPDGTVKVLDFGIAKTIDAKTTSGGRTPTVMTPAVTESGVILGTAAYMAPEQARGRPVDQRADIWAFGCLLFEMLTGQPAFTGEDVMVTLARVLDRDTDFRSVPGTVSPAVRQAIKLCLEKHPGKRIADIRDVVLALEGAFTPERTVAGEGDRALPPRRRVLQSVVAVLAGGAAVGIAAALLWPQADAPPVRPYRLSPPAGATLADLIGPELAVSPNGRYVVYLAVGDDPLQVELVLHDLEELDARVLPGTAVDSNNETTGAPFFSADSSWIGYWSEVEGLMRVPVAGGPPSSIAEITGVFSGATVKGDGTVIFATAFDGFFRVSSGGGGVPEPLPGEIDDGYAYVRPTILPGERQLLFSRLSDDGSDEIGVMDLASGAVEIVIRDGTSALYAPSGHILFMRGATLMAARFDAERLVAEEAIALPPGIRAPEGSAGDYSLAADGTLVYVEGDDSPRVRPELTWLNRDGSVDGRTPVATSSLFLVSPRLSPDDGRVILMHYDSGRAFDLWVHDLVGGRTPIPIMDLGGSLGSAWNPAGDSIAFAWSPGNGRPPTVVVVPDDGTVSEPDSLRPDQLAAIPKVWTEGGDLIGVAVTGDGADGSPYDIVAFRADGSGEVRPIAARTDSEFDPALSPNGRWLAFARERDGVVNVYVQGYPEGAAVPVSPDGGREPVWSRDGRTLYYLEGTTLKAVPVNTDAAVFDYEPPYELFVMPFPVSTSRFLTSYDVAGDDRFLVVGRPGTEADASARIVVVQNFLEVLRRQVPQP